MPHLHYQRSPDGLIVPIVIGLDDDSIAALHAAGAPILAPIHAMGIIDTGADLTGITSRLLAQLPFRSMGQGTTIGVSGAAYPNLFAISLSLVRRQEIRHLYSRIPS